MKSLIAIAALVASNFLFAAPVELVCISITDEGNEMREVTFDEETGKVAYAKNANKMKDCEEQQITEKIISCDMGRRWDGLKTLIEVDRFSGVLTVSTVDPFKHQRDYYYDCSLRDVSNQRF